MNLHAEAAHLTESVAADVAVRRLGAGDLARWDAYVRAHADASFFHRAGWKRVIEAAFGHRTHFLLAERGGEIVGVLPLAEIRSRLFGHSLGALPFCAYGGILADHDAAYRALDEAAQALARELNVGALEYRNQAPQHAHWPTKNLYVTFKKSIEPEIEANMNAIPRKQRAMVRKGIKAGLVGEIDSDTTRFFDAYSASVHRLGTPVFSRRYFQLLKDAFGDDCEVLTITQGGTLIASVLSFYFRDEVLPYYGGGTDAARARVAARAADIAQARDALVFNPHACFVGFEDDPGGAGGGGFGLRQETRFRLLQPVFPSACWFGQVGALDGSPEGQANITFGQVEQFLGAFVGV